MMLTMRQRQLFEFVKAEIQANGRSPTIRAATEHMGYASVANVHRILKSLCDRGYLHKVSSRRYDVIEKPHDAPRVLYFKMEDRKTRVNGDLLWPKLTLIRDNKGNPVTI